MARYRWLGGAIAMLVVGASDLEAQQLPRAVFVVNMHDYASVNTKDLDAAKAKTTAIFDKASVAIRWSPVQGEEGERASEGCVRPFTIEVLIRPTNATWQPGRRRIMGIALAADHVRGVVSLFYDAIFDVAHRYRMPIQEVFALALTHELGHALLPPPSHSSSGVMQARLEGDDLRHAMTETLEFTAEQASMLRTKALSRVSCRREPS